MDYLKTLNILSFFKAKNRFHFGTSFKASWKSFEQFRFQFRHQFPLKIIEISPMVGIGFALDKKCSAGLVGSLLNPVEGFWKSNLRWEARRRLAFPFPFTPQNLLPMVGGSTSPSNLLSYPSLVNPNWPSTIIKNPTHINEKKSLSFSDSFLVGRGEVLLSALFPR